ncbi:MAG TPA: hypothetical protein VGN31_03585 [Paraburkholderia sp.]|jgi:hypothetical protein
MSAQITRDQSFPTPCKRCGGVLYQHVDFCPYCGTDRPLETAAHAHPGAHTRAQPDTTLRAIGPAGPATPAPAAPAAHAAALSAGDAAATDLPPVKPDFRDDAAIERRSPFWHTTQWIFTKGLLLVAFIVALGYAAYLLLGENKKPEPTPDDQYASSSVGSISPYSTQQANADGRTPPAVPKPRVMPQFKDVPDSLRAARASLAENNLSDAKAATNAALAREADNEDARDLQRDIAAREQRRDTALQGADRCASERSWGCVQRQASDALAIDSSSLHAQSLLERAILSTGWIPLTPPKASTAGTAASGAPAATAANAAPLPRGASNVRLPSSQDWGAAASAASKNPAASKNSTASTPLPPLPPMSSAPPNAAAIAPTPAPASTPTNAPASAPSAANTNTAAAASAATPASNDNSADAQERAIRQSGWKHAVPSDTAH